MRLLTSICILGVLIASVFGAPTISDNALRDAQCSVCHALVEDMSKYVSDKKTQGKLQDYLDDICNQHEDSLLCKTVVNGYSEEMFHLIAQELDPESVCNLAELCGADNVKKSDGLSNFVEEEQDIILQENPRNAKECEICKMIVSYVNKYLEDNKTIGAINATLEKLCNSLPGEAGDLCKQFEPDLIRVLQEGLDPKEACEKIKLCPGSKAEHEEETYKEHIEPEQIEEDEYEEEPRLEDRRNVERIEEEEYEEEPRLEDRRHVEKLEEEEYEEEPYIEDKRPVEKVEEEEYEEEPYIEDRRYKEPVEKEQHEKLSYLEDNRTQRKVEHVHPDRNIGASKECEICKFIIQAVDNIIEKNSTIDKINATLEKLCNILPGEAGRLCKKYEADLIKVLEKGLDPEKACEEIHLCNSTSVSVHLQVDMKKIMEEGAKLKASKECEICKFIIQAVDNIIEKNSTIDKINATLEKLCSLLPGEAGRLCKKYEADLIKVLEKGLDPEKACEEIKLCNSSLLHLIPKVEFNDIMEEARNQKANKCVTCKLVVQAVDLIMIVIIKNSTVKQMNATLEHLCNKLPGEAGRLCKKHERDLLEILVNGLDPRRLCAKLQFCNSTKDNFLNRVNIEELIEEAGKFKASKECEICKFIIQAVDNIIEKNSTIEKINATLEKLCNILPGEAGRLCKKYEAELIKVLEKGLDPEKACEEIKLCNKTSLHIIPRVDFEEIMEEADKLKASKECEICKFIIQAVDNIIEKNSTIDKINATLEKLCNILPGEAGRLCKKYEAELIKVLEKGLDPEKACEEIKLCNKTSLHVIPKVNFEELIEEAGKFKASKECEICKFIIQAVDNIIEKNSTIDKINATLEKLCDILPGEAGKLCKKYEADLIKVLEKGLDPQKACEEIHLCNKTSLHVIPKVNFEELIEEASKFKASKECEICKFIIQAVDNIIEKNSTIDKINATLEKLCNILPGEAGKLCKKYEADLIKVLEKGLDPQKACEEIHLCNKTSLHVIPKVDFEELMEEASKFKASKECEICKFIIQAVDNIIEKNSTIDKINATLEKLCNILPGEAGKLCKKYEAELIKVLEKGLDPQKACEEIHLCNSTHAFSAKAIEKELFRETMETANELQGTTECEICKFIIQTMDNIIEQNKTIESINATLEKLCAKLPGKVGELCEKYEAELIAVLEKGLSPEDACKAIKLCKSKYEVVEPLEVERYEETTKCRLCKYIFTALDNIVDENSTEEEINATLTKICTALPNEFGDICRAYQNEILKIIEKGFKPDKVCVEIKMCEAPTDTKYSFLEITCDTCHSVVEYATPYRKMEEVFQAVCKPLCHKRRRRSALETNKTKKDEKKLVIKKNPRLMDNKKGCEICEFVLKELDQIIGKKKNGDAVNSLYKICKMLPAEFKQECLKLAPEMLAVLAEEVDPKKACSMISACSSKIHHGESSILAVPHGEFTEKKVGDTKCTICKASVETVCEQIEKKSGNIQDYIDSICDRLPEPTKDACRNAIDPNFQTFFNATLAKLPGIVCRLIELCPKNATMQATGYGRIE